MDGIKIDQQEYVGQVTRTLARPPSQARFDVYVCRVLLFPAVPGPSMKMWRVEVAVDGLVKAALWHTSEADAVAAILTWAPPAFVVLNAVIDAERELQQVLCNAEARMSVHTATRLRIIYDSLQRALGAIELE